MRKSNHRISNKQKVILSLMLAFITINAYTQSSVLDSINKMKPKYERIIAKQIKKQFGKEASNRYRNFLFIPRIYLKNLEITDEIYLKGSTNDTTLISIRKNPTSENLRLDYELDNRTLIYDDSLCILGVFNRKYIYRVSKENDILLKYYLSINADLLFFIESLFDYFVLIDNKVWMLKFNEDTKEYEKVEP